MEIVGIILISIFFIVWSVTYDKNNGTKWIKTSLIGLSILILIPLWLANMMFIGLMISHVVGVFCAALFCLSLVVFEIRVFSDFGDTLT